MISPATYRPWRRLVTSPRQAIHVRDADSAMAGGLASLAEPVDGIFLGRDIAIEMLGRPRTTTCASRSQEETTADMVLDTRIPRAGGSSPTYSTLGLWNSILLARPELVLSLSVRKESERDRWIVPGQRVVCPRARTNFCFVTIPSSMHCHPKSSVAFVELSRKVL